jgi:hypothetical protein
VSNVTRNSDSAVLTTNNANFTGTGGGVASDLFISGYIEGGVGSNKCIEIFNGTGSTIDASATYRLGIGVNGGAVTTTLALTALTAFANNTTYVVCNSSADSTLTGIANLNTTNGVVNFNGDDAIVLQKYIASVWTTIDVIGVVGVDPGAAWTVPGGANSASIIVGGSTADTALTRKPTVVSPKSTWDASEWNTANAGTLLEIQANHGLGSHTFTP